MVAGGHAWSGGHACVAGGGGRAWIRRDRANERAVRILLKCILVLENKFVSARQNQTLI